MAGAPNPNMTANSPRRSPGRADGMDERILQILHEDSRRPFAEIGKSVGISAPAVRRRIERMTQNGVIKRFTIERNDEGTSAIVLVSVGSGHDTAQTSEMLAGLKGIKTVYEITGQYDIVTIINAPTIAEINSSIDALRRTPGITDTNTVIILRKIRTE